MSLWKNETLTRWTLLDTFCLHIWAWLLLYSAITPKNEDKKCPKVFNGSEFHFSEVTFFQNWYFKHLVISRLYAYISKLVEFQWTIINSSLNLLPPFGMIFCNAENFYFPILIFYRAIAIHCSPIQIHAITVLARKLICWPSPFTIDSPFNKIINLFIILVIAMDSNIRLSTDY